LTCPVCPFGLAEHVHGKKKGTHKKKKGRLHCSSARESSGDFSPHAVANEEGHVLDLRNRSSWGEEETEERGSCPSPDLVIESKREGRRPLSPISSERKKKVGGEALAGIFPEAAQKKKILELRSRPHGGKLL